MAIDALSRQKLRGRKLNEPSVPKLPVAAVRQTTVSGNAKWILNYARTRFIQFIMLNLEFSNYRQKIVRSHYSKVFYCIFAQSQGNKTLIDLL